MRLAARIELAREVDNFRKQCKVMLGNIEYTKAEHFVDVIIVARKPFRRLFRLRAVVLMVERLNLLPKSPLSLYDRNIKRLNLQMRFKFADKARD